MCSYYLSKKSIFHEQVAFRVDALSDVAIRIPIIVKAEILFGITKSGMIAKNRAVYGRFLNARTIVNLNDEALVHYARIRADLERKGTIIGGNDLFIAAIVLAHKGILITHNTDEFRRVVGLKLEDWTL
jgi:tRNA(fMet)-specific endonuclease VapC